MLAFKLAYKNLLGAGLRTWLNVFVLSLSLVLLVMAWGILDGWNIQAKKDMKEWEVGGGEYWHDRYDPYDPLSLNDAHGLLPTEIETLRTNGDAVPVLITQATVYPQGRMKNILLKGIDASQQIIKMPTSLMKEDSSTLNAIIGIRMANASKLSENDIVTIRWRDSNGTFDAAEIRIAGIFHSNVATIDINQIWLPLDRLQQMTSMKGQATYIILKRGIMYTPTIPGWIHKGYDVLFADFDTIIKTKHIASSTVYLILLSLALLAVFDTQVLSIFRREKEIGTYIALGMTRWQVVRLFTVEGAMHAVLAVIAGAIWGTPLLYLLAKYGLAMPKGTEGYGFTLAEKIYPVYGAGTIIIMSVIVMAATAIVSYIPSRKIAKMKPTEALRGKVQ
jgi:ABC-type lipoprotein release transport system permease subunit